MKTEVIPRGQETPIDRIRPEFIKPKYKRPETYMQYYIYLIIGIAGVIILIMIIKALSKYITRMWG